MCCSNVIARSADKIGATKQPVHTVILRAGGESMHSNRASLNRFPSFEGMTKDALCRLFNVSL